MSSYATEGAQPPGVPAGEPATVAASGAGPADGAGPAEAPGTAGAAEAAEAEGTARATGTAGGEGTAGAAGTAGDQDDPGGGPGDLDGPEAPSAVPRAEPVSKLAVLALVTSVIAVVPVAVGAAVGALAVIRRTGRRGHGLAMAALFVAAAWVIVGGAIGTVGVLTHGFKKPVTVKYRESAVFKLEQGDCVDAPNGQQVSVLPCSAPHEAEVFATFSLPASAWPGTDALRGEASSGCASRLSGYLNPQLAVSLAQSYVFPNEVAWTAGTRTVICEVRATSGQLTGSVRGGSLPLLSSRRAARRLRPLC